MSTFKLGLAIAAAIPLLLGTGCNNSTIGGEGTDDGGTNEDLAPPPPPPIPGCTGACVVNTSCSSATGPTTLTGTVTIPSGLLPLYNAKVYIPTGTSLPPAPPSGATCDRCDATTDAIASTTTDINGKFTLTNVPSGQNIPLIIKVGKWRKVVTIPSVTDCTTTPLAAADTRLPRNKNEGNIPQIALSTGSADALECILRNKKLGLDDSEFSTEKGTGRVHLYRGANGVPKFATSLNGGATLTAAQQTGGATKSWYDDINNWSKYDIVMLSCEGGELTAYKSPQAIQNLETYLGMGGRVFASHYHYAWMKYADATKQQIPKVVTAWGTGNTLGTGTVVDDIDTNFDRGNALADWLMLPAVNGSTTRGKISIGQARTSVNTIDSKLTQRWIRYQQTATTALPQYFSFNAPVGAQASAQCGQMVFTDLHVSSGGGDSSPDTGDFPTQCTATTMSAQEKALIFMLFDLTNCLSPIVG